MSDIKLCPSCGASLSVSALFCPKCGQKQMESNSEPKLSDETLEPKNGDQTSSQGEEQPVEKVQTPEVASQAPPTSEIHSETGTTPVTPVSKPIPQMVPPPPQQQPVIYPQTPIAKHTPEVKEIKKKKFPWFFTVLWLILLLCVGIWAYFLFVDAGYDYPIITEDVQRLVLFTVASAFLIYTLSLKLSMRKLRAFPTVILVIAALVIFYFFCMVELTEGDWLHDIVSNITNNIIPTSGK